MTDTLNVAGRTLSSRLIIGTGKYKTYAENAEAAEAAGAEMVTVAVRRVNLADKDQPMLVDYLDPEKYIYLPNTAGCFTAEGRDPARSVLPGKPAAGTLLSSRCLLIKKRFTLICRKPCARQNFSSKTVLT